MHWTQNYDPLGSPTLATLCAALPLIVLLGAIGFVQVRAHLAALLGLAMALLVSVLVFRMPLSCVASAAAYGAAYGLMPIGWIILNLLFLYQMTVKHGSFASLREHFRSIVPDKRIQLLLVAFSFGAFFEGAAGFGTPVAITAAILIQLGFSPLQASVYTLIANTAPVAYGALGTPIVALSGVTGISVLSLSAMVGRQLPFFTAIIPFWVVAVYAGRRGLMGVWPAALVAGLGFAIPQYLISNYHGPWLVDIAGSICSLSAILVLLKYWRPSDPHYAAAEVERAESQNTTLSRADVARGWAPWILLATVIFLWGLPPVKDRLKQIGEPKLPVPGLHQVVSRGYPVVVKPTVERPTNPEAAVFDFNWLSATGSGILVAAILAGFLMRFSPAEMLRVYVETLIQVRFTLVTIAAMLALGFVTKYSGADATLGLALARTGVLYPFFGTLLGWLGVALTGSDTSSNVLFGSLQTITASQAGISPTLMAAANATGGVMGKMVNAQSIVVASTATNYYGHEGLILRRVFLHSLFFAALVGLFVVLQAYVYPFTCLVVQ
jgi:lactate permease